MDSRVRGSDGLGDFLRVHQDWSVVDGEALQWKLKSRIALKPEGPPVTPTADLHYAFEMREFNS